MIEDKVEITLIESCLSGGLLEKLQQWGEVVYLCTPGGLPPSQVPAL